MKLYSKYLSFASTKPWFLVLLTLLVLVSGIPLKNIQVNNKPEDWYPKNSRQLPDKKVFEEYFGNDEVMILYLTFPKNSTQSFKNQELKKISLGIEKIHGFEQTFSRLNINFLNNLMDEDYVKNIDKVYFSSKNKNGEAIFLKVRLHPNPDQNRPLIIDSLKTLVYPIINPKIRKDLSGSGVIFSEINELSTQDSSWLFILCYVLIFLLLWWRLRKMQYVILCSFIVFIALWPSMSLFAWFNVPINMITLIVPLLFIINFYSFALHLVTKQSSKVSEYLKIKIPPILISALANIIGFGSLMLSNITVIYQFGLLTSLGIIVGLLVLLLIGTPLVIRFIDINLNIEKIDWMNKLLDGFYKKLSPNLSKILLIITFVVIGIGIVVFQKITVDTDSIAFIKPENKTRISKEYIETNYGSINRIDFLLDKTDGKFFKAKDWKVVAKVREDLYTMPFVKSVEAYDLWKPLVDKLKLISPNDAKKLKAGMVSEDKKHTRITIQIPSGSVKSMEAYILKAQTKINSSIGDAAISARAVGYLPAYVEQMNVIVDEMLSSLAIAVILILIVISIFVQNIKLGILATLATVFPLFGVVILMQGIHIPFDIATSVIFSVVVGMIADDILHIVWNYKNDLKQNPNQAINVLFANSVRKIVHPCTATSLMFAIGFAVLLSSNIVFIVEFGILSTSAIIFAWISDFIFFPAILRVAYKK